MEVIKEFHIHPRDLCCVHLHKEEEALIHMRMYGMDVIHPNLEKTKSIETIKQSQLPSNLDEVDSFLSKATNEKPSPITMKDESSPRLSKSNSILRKEGEPYNEVHGCDIDEIAPQKGEVRCVLTC